MTPHLPQPRRSNDDHPLRLPYSAKPAPSPRRARTLLAEKGVAHQTVEVDLRSGEQLSDAYRNVNPQCTVPALRTYGVLAYRRRLLAPPSFARAVDEARPFRPCFPLGAPDRD